MKNRIRLISSVGGKYIGIVAHEVPGRLVLHEVCQISQTPGKVHGTMNVGLMKIEGSVVFHGAMVVVDVVEGSDMYKFYKKAMTGIDLMSKDARVH